MKEIYEAILKEAKLTPAHKKELIEKRGFSDEIIKAYRYGSTNQSLKRLENSLKETFKEDDLIRAGVFLRPKDTSKPPFLLPMLLEDRIIIPYLNKDREAMLLRPHKMGLPNVGVEIYCDYILGKSDGEIVITEGEFKATAATEVFQLPTIAIPGIMSFSEQHFPRLVKALNDYKIKRVTIVFDNEVKDDPAFASFKEDPNKRHDTNFYAYYMARKLDAEGKEVRIGMLPDSWRVNGKIDFDGAAAQKRTRGEVIQVIHNAQTHKEFLKDTQAECRQVILRKMAQKRHRSHITTDFGRYVATRRRGKMEWDDPISNFTMKIIATHETPEGIMREIVFADEQGKRSASFTISANDMIKIDNFGVFAANKGNFIWRGNKDDLLTIWESEFLMMDEGRRIVEPDHIGWIEEEKAWLFGNIAFIEEEKDGVKRFKEVRPDKSNTFWLEKRGLRPIPLAAKGGASESIPYLSTKEFNIKEFVHRLSETIGDAYAKIAVGWVTATVFMEEIYKLYGCFPFLFVTGQRGTGKTTVAEWIMHLTGIEDGGRMISETTPVAIQRFLAYGSALPLFLDEFRNNEAVRWKIGLLRNAYNRQSAGKGVKSDFGIREARVRGTLLLSGEETPEDSALLSRCVQIFVTRKARVSNHFEWFQANKLNFSYHFYDIIKRSHSLRDKFFGLIREAQEAKIADDERTIINYGIVAAGYAVASGDEDIDFAKKVVKEAARVFEESTDELPVKVFLEYLIAMKTKRLIDDRYWLVDTDDTRGGRKVIWFYFEGLYNEWSQEFRKTRGALPFKKQSLRSYLQEEEGFLEIRCNKRIQGVTKSCSVFDYETASDLMKNLVTDPPKPDGSASKNPYAE